jgi:hypothetical protein
MNFLLSFFTLLACLPLAAPAGILATIFLMYRKLNKGNLPSVGPPAQPDLLRRGMRLPLLRMKNMIGHQYTSNHQQCIREGREDFTRET